MSNTNTYPPFKREQSVKNTLFKKDKSVNWSGNITIPSFLLVILFFITIPLASAENIYFTDDYILDDLQVLPQLINQTPSDFPESNSLYPEYDYFYPEEDEGVGGPDADSQSDLPQYNTGSGSLNPPGAGSSMTVDPNSLKNSNSMAVPVAKFTATPLKGMAPLTVKFQDQSTGNPTEWFWNLGNGKTTSEKSPTALYSKEGTYTVYLTVSNDLGLNTASADIEVLHEKTVVIADFFYALKGKGLPQKVEFYDISEGHAESWFWTFGDGGTSREKNPVYYYKDAGNYDVTLNASNKFFSSSKTNNVLIDEEILPKAHFYSDVLRGPAPLTVTFTDTSTGNPTKWFWKFGDGATSAKQNPVHTYQKPGDYDVSLQVSNTKGTAHFQTTIYVEKGVAKTKPTANYNQVPLSGCAPLKVTFTDLSTGEPSSWKWDFGDGATSTEQNPIHTFVTPGTYWVYLTASNSLGESYFASTVEIPCAG